MLLRKTCGRGAEQGSRGGSTRGRIQGKTGLGLIFELQLILPWGSGARPWATAVASTANAPQQRADGTVCWPPECLLGLPASNFLQEISFHTHTPCWFCFSGDRRLMQALVMKLGPL